MTDLEEPDRGRALRFRNRELVVAIVGYVYDADGPVPWNEILEVFSEDGRPWKTIENTLYDLLTFGALHRIGKPAQRSKPDSRALKPTVLGRAWLDRELLPLPTDPVDPDFVDLVPDDLQLPVHTLEPGSETADP